MKQQELEKIKERDAVLSRRKDFIDGAVCWVSEARSRADRGPGSITLAMIEADAAKKFPLPKVEIPREVSDGSITWRVVDELLQHRFDDEPGRWHHGMNVFSPKRRAVLADLLTRPTEFVDADSPRIPQEG